MRRKLLDDAYTAVGAISAIQVLYQIIEIFLTVGEKESKLDLIIAIIMAACSICVFSYIIYGRKRKLIDAFDVLKILSENNKLHTLREVVMIRDRQYSHKENQYIFQNASFKYTILTNDRYRNYFDVRYEIGLELVGVKEKFLRRNNDFSVMRFFAILDSQDVNDLRENGISIEIYQRGRENDQICFSVNPRDVTISPLDHISQCTSLYEIDFNVPDKWMKDLKSMPIQIKVSYQIEKAIEFSDGIGEREYNFVIIPSNYGKRIENCSIELLVPNDMDFSMEVQRACAGHELEKIMDLVPGQTVENGLLEYKLPDVSFSPDADTVYFVHVTKNK